MATRQGNVRTSHAVADSISPDSLSFSGLVSIHEMQSELPSPKQAKHYQVSKPDPEFEFTSTKPNLKSEVNPIKITPAVHISNGQHQQQAVTFKASQPLIINPSSSLSSLLETHSSSSSMLAGKTVSARKHHDQLAASRGRDTINKSTVERTGFGEKMKCFLSPCRECRAIKPDAAKAQTVRRENSRIY